MMDHGMCRGEPILDRTEENLLPESAFKDEYGNWREDWPMIQAILVCVNDNCRFRGEEILAYLAENVDGRYRSSCGICSEVTAKFYPVPCPD